MSSRVAAETTCLFRNGHQKVFNATRPRVLQAERVIAMAISMFYFNHLVLDSGPCKGESSGEMFSFFVGTMMEKRRSLGCFALESGGVSSLLESSSRLYFVFLKEHCMTQRKLSSSSLRSALKG